MGISMSIKQPTAKSQEVAPAATNVRDPLPWLVSSLRKQLSVPERETVDGTDKSDSAPVPGCGRAVIDTSRKEKRAPANGCNDGFIDDHVDPRCQVND